MIYDMMMVSKGITLLEQTATFIDYIQEWRQQTTNLKTWAAFKTLSHRDHHEQRRLFAEAERGDTPQHYRIYMVYRHLHLKIIIR